MIEPIEKNLEKGKHLITKISNQQYSDSSVAPYYSSIGCHMRHILDVFYCVLEGYKNNHIDLTIRKRDISAELDTSVCKKYFSTIIAQVKLLKPEDLLQNIKVTDDLGLGKTTVNYTLGAILMQAHSHAIHHYASIGYIIYQLGIELPDSDFGFNPTTPKKNLSKVNS